MPPSSLMLSALGRSPKGFTRSSAMPAAHR